MPERKHNRISLILFLLLLVTVFSACVWMISSYFLAIFSGAVFALLSRRIYARLTQKGFGPKWASLIVTVGIFVLIIGPLSMFLTLAIKQGIVIGQNLADNQTLSFDSILGRISHFGPIESIIGDPAAVERQLRGNLQNAVRFASGFVVGIAAALPLLALQVVLAAISCFFFLMDGKKFLAWLGQKIPMDPVVSHELKKTFEDTTVSVIWATLAAAAVQAVVLFIGYIALGVPGAFLGAAATFIFAWIPMVGSAPIWIVGAIYLYIQSSIAKVIIMTAIGLFAGVIDNFVRPLVLKGRSSIHPLVSLIAIFGGLQVFGIMGAFVGPILVATLIALVQILPLFTQRMNGGMQSKGDIDKDTTEQKLAS